MTIHTSTSRTIGADMMFRFPDQLRFEARIFAALALALACLAAGCVTRTPASPTRLHDAAAIPAREFAWPQRDPAAVLAYTQRIGLPICAGRQLPGSFDINEDAARLLRCCHWYAPLTVCRGCFGQAVVYESAILPPPKKQTVAYYIIVSELTPDELETEVRRDDHDKGDARGRQRLTHWNVKLEMPESDPPRGLIIHQISLGNTSYERSIIDTFRRRGWATLTVTPGGFLLNFIAPIDEGTPRDAPPAPGEPSPGAIERRRIDVQSLSTSLDHYAVDGAYAVEAALRCLADARPEVPQRPLVLVGFSLGALSLPTTAARLNECVDAAVMVGGGANIAEILLEGDVTRPRGGGLAGNALAHLGIKRALADLPARHLEISRFDPYHTASCLRAKPVLLVHASFDRIVPASTGQLLYERLGRPERWTFPLGHLGLFWRLPAIAEDLADWVEQTVPAMTTPTSSESGVNN